MPLYVHFGEEAFREARVAIAHALVPQEAQAVSQELEKRLGCCQPLTAGIGPVIGTHTGPGVIGVATYS